MHPEVRQVGPGSCPKCGMALEPVEVTAEEDNSELIDMQSAILGVPGADRTLVRPGDG